MADLTPSDLLSIMAAMASDEGTKTRVAELYEAQQEHDKSKAEATALVAEANQARIDATRIRALSEAERQTLAGKQAELEKFELTLSDHNQALIAEKAAWEKIRQAVDAEQAAQGQKLAKWNEELHEFEQAVNAREFAVFAREQAALSLAAESEMRIKRMRDALHAIDPPPPEEPQKDAA